VETLSVILDTHPLVTFIVVVGWAFKTFVVTTVVIGWVAASAADMHG
jgi:hypothetical protein